VIFRVVCYNICNNLEQRCIGALTVHAVRIILYSIPPIGHMDWIAFRSAFRSSLWIGLGHRVE